MNDEDLRDELTKWQFDVSDDPHFKRSVWREIERRESPPLQRAISALLDLIDRPRLAIPLGAVALMTTAVLAILHGQQFRNNTWDTLALSYKATIDPVTNVTMARTTNDPR